ncbi:MAG TPA: hypothetical protein VLQ66_10240 [Paenisporosarcina sp.]|nr:hypothetical protein [Paenisporosarcina sp.]
MTNFNNLLDNLKESLSFESISEHPSKGVAVRIIVHGSVNETDLLIFPHSTVKRYQLDFPSYVSYSVTFEDYTALDESERYEGNAFRLYSKSNYFDFLQKTSNLQRQYNGEICTVYAMMCIEHVVNIVSYAEPTIAISQLGPNLR